MPSSKPKKRKGTGKPKPSAIKIGFTDEDYAWLTVYAQEEGMAVGPLVSRIVNNWMSRPAVVERIRAIAGDKREIE